MKLLGKLLVLSIVAGCSTLAIEGELKFDALVIQNNSGLELQDVKIKVEKTGALAYCSLILPDSSCSTLFPEMVYQKNPIFISWTQNGRSRVVGPVMVELPEKTDGSLNASALIEFVSPEQISARFVY